MTTRHYGPDLIQQLVRTELTEIAWNDQFAGEVLSQYDVVYLDGDFWRLADARVPNRARRPLGIATDDIASGSIGDIYLRALLSNSAWVFTSGDRVFLASGGGVTMSGPEASGDTSCVLGRATTVTQMEFHPQPAMLIAV